MPGQNRRVKPLRELTEIVLHVLELPTELVQAHLWASRSSGRTVSRTDSTSRLSTIRRFWIPSWRFRSILLRASSPAATRASARMPISSERVVAFEIDVAVSSANRATCCSVPRAGMSHPSRVPDMTPTAGLRRRPAPRARSESRGCERASRAPPWRVRSCPCARRERFAHDAADRVVLQRQARPWYVRVAEAPSATATPDPSGINRTGFALPALTRPPVSAQTPANTRAPRRRERPVSRSVSRRLLFSQAAELTAGLRVRDGGRDRAR